MSLSYGLSLNSLVYFAISISCMLENDMVSVERVNQYSTLPSVAAWAVSDCLPSANWLRRGDIDIKDLEVSIFSLLIILLASVSYHYYFLCD